MSELVIPHLNAEIRRLSAELEQYKAELDTRTKEAMDKMRELEKTNAMLADNWTNTERLLKSAAKKAALVPDLAMLVTRLAYFTRPAHHESSVKALEFLGRHGLTGSPLREE